MELPDWYYRVSVTSDLENREVRGSDFDEDISELGEGEGDSEGSGSDAACECGSEDGCECDSWEDECECDPWVDDDEESEHSYTGSDAYNYYDLKRARKIRLRDEKEQVPENPIVYPAYEAILNAQNERGCPENEDRAEEARGEQEVYAAYEAMLEARERGDCPKIKPIFDQSFTLYSVDFHDYCSHESFFRTPYVEFSALCWDPDDVIDPDETMAYGHIYLDSNSVSEFAAFWPPRRAGQLMIPLSNGPEECNPIIQFISDEYFIMTVRTDLDIVANRIRIRNPEATNIPDVFHFVGIRDGQYDKYDSDADEFDS
ncbi:hypothetical protein VB005_06547 [Metarhizium brunneum]